MHPHTYTHQKKSQEKLIKSPEEKARGAVTTMTYVNFFKAGAGYLVLLVILFLFLLGEVCQLRYYSTASS